ncbi:hypothetical protein Tco_1184136 [Tanacetum coccineum]
MQEEKDDIFDVLHMLTRRHMLEAVSHSKNTCSLVSMVALHVVQAMEGISIPRRDRFKRVALRGPFPSQLSFQKQIDDLFPTLQNKESDVIMPRACEEEKDEMMADQIPLLLQP